MRMLKRLMLVVSVIWVACVIGAQIFNGDPVRGRDILVAAFPPVFFSLVLFVLGGRPNRRAEKGKP